MSTAEWVKLQIAMRSLNQVKLLAHSPRSSQYSEFHGPSATEKQRHLGRFPRRRQARSFDNKLEQRRRAERCSFRLSLHYTSQWKNGRSVDCLCRDLTSPHWLEAKARWSNSSEKSRHWCQQGLRDRNFELWYLPRPIFLLDSCRFIVDRWKYFHRKSHLFRTVLWEALFYPLEHER